MSWRLLWTEPAEQSLRRIPWSDGARVDAAILLFASTGRGDLRRLPEDDATTLRLRVGVYRVRMSVDPLDQVITIWMIYRADR